MTVVVFVGGAQWITPVLIKYYSGIHLTGAESYFNGLPDELLGNIKGNFVY